MNIESFVNTVTQMLALNFSRCLLTLKSSCLLHTVENLINSFCSYMFCGWYGLYIAADTSEESFVLCRYIETLQANTFDRYIVFYREYWMVCIGPGFLAVVWFGSSPTLPPVGKLNRRHTERLRKRNNLLKEKRGYRMGDEPNLTTARKPDPLQIINILSGLLHFFILLLK